jgi:hypothetical protein
MSSRSLSEPRAPTDDAVTDTEIETHSLYKVHFRARVRRPSPRAAIANAQRTTESGSGTELTIIPGSWLFGRLWRSVVRLVPAKNRGERTTNESEYCSATLLKTSIGSPPTTWGGNRGQRCDSHRRDGGVVARYRRGPTFRECLRSLR